MENEISIIIPIYNVEKYLSPCLDSVLNQTYKNLEIILVNDGSTDACAEICDSYATTDSRIKIVHQKNGGLSDARNSGLKMVTGDCVGFVDSDDVISVDFYSKMLHTLQDHNADIVECNFMRFSAENEWQSVPAVVDNTTGIYSAEEALQLLMKQQLKQIVWNKLYKTTIIKGLLFEKGRLHEDEFWTYKVFGEAKKIIKIPDILYFYRQQDSSIMGKGYSLKRLDGLEALEQRVVYIHTNFPTLSNTSVRSFWLASLHHYQNISHLPGLDPNGEIRKKIWCKVKEYDQRKYYKGWTIKEILWFKLFLIAPDFCVRFRNYIKIGI